MVTVGVIGGAGYTGSELLRILSRHPQVKITAITSRAEAGKPVASLFPSLRGHTDLCFSDPADDGVLRACDVVMSATPNGIAMMQAPGLLAAGVRLIDIAADFRIKDIAVWERWYGMAHNCPDLVAEAVYGLPEMYRDAISSARLVANPGCYPTAVQLGFLPLIENDLVDLSSLMAAAVSGVSGAGRSPHVPTLFAEASESVKAYNVGGHRHQPEIAQGLAHMAQKPVDFVFVPHLVPMIRGIHATLYGRLKDPMVDLQALYESRYRDEPFVDVLPAGSHPETRTVRGTNLCRIAVHKPKGSDKVIVLSAIDNLTKGASGQAVQNLNLMCGFEETMGLTDIALFP
ncbi:MAG TPA: N-acetyl-gamma-glutamyl-phosphate reductase [Acidiferrobacter sp.]|nr:N-acetyl-gamma-glutamyl-phosphate reductase [Acidiferrobacter sp.]